MELEQIKQLAKKSNGETWKLLATATEKSAPLTDDERAEILNSVYGSLYLWSRAGATDLHFARGHWLISRVLCVLNEPSLADQHVRLCARFTEAASDKKDFDQVYAVEAQARVAALKGERETAQRLKTEATRLAKTIADKEDREIAEGDVAAEPWFGL